MAWSTALESMELVLIVYEELGGDNCSMIMDLVTPYRIFVRADDIQMREVVAGGAKKVDRRLYIFRDLLILAKPETSLLSSTLKKSTVQNASKQSHPGTAVLTGKGGKYKPDHYLNLQKCSAKEIPPTECEKGQGGITLTYVSREKMPTGGKHGTLKIVTKIEKIELFFPSPKIAEEVLEAILDAIDELDELEHARRESNLGLNSPNGTATPNSSATSPNGETPGKARSWALKRNTLKAAQHKSSASLTDDTSSVTDSVAGGLSLQDLEERYKVDLSSTSLSSEKAEFEVQFGEGAMGFSLGSGPGVGVIIGRLAPGSFAEMGGVCIGDRILRVNDKDIGLDYPWQKCVDDIKAMGRPILIKFERCAARQYEHHHHSENETSHNHNNNTTPVKGTAPSSGGGKTTPPLPSTPATPGSEEQHKGLHKQRSWAARRAHAASLGTGVISLNELEKLYHSSSNTVGSEKESSQILGVFDTLKQECGSNEAEVKCAHVLKEIFVTEKLYVDDLRTMVGEYILPLRRTMRRSLCKELEGAGAICEHNLIRSTCKKYSTEAHPILDGDDVKRIFLNVETLVKVNSELLGVIEKGLLDLAQKYKKDPTSGKPTLAIIAQIYAPAFVKVMPFFKMYSMYCHQYSNAVERLQYCRANNKVLDEFLSGREKKSEKTSLSSLLIKPVQRICKYPLLFQELLRSLPQTDAAYLQELKSAAAAVDDIAASVNKNVGDRDAVEKIMAIYEELGGEQAVPGLITAHRRFVKHVNILLTIMGDKDEKKDYVLYLFNDWIVLAKGHRGGLTLGGGTAGHKSSTSNLISRRSFGFGLGYSTAKGNGTGKSDKNAQLKVTHQLDLSFCEVKLNPTPDKEGCYSFSLKHVQRSATKDSKQGSSKILTSVDKYEIWLPTQEDAEEICNEIKQLIERQDNLAAGQKKAESEIGSGTVKAKRSWRDKANKPGASIGELSQKYHPTDSHHEEDDE